MDAVPAAEATPVRHAQESEAGLDDCRTSPFLDELLCPPETVVAEDATRTYRTMDAVDLEGRVFEPRRPNVTPREESCSVRGGGPWATWHRRGELWRHCASSTDAERASNRPPRWFEQLCRSLFFREGSSAPRLSAAAPAATAEDVDPYTWLPFRLMDEADYCVAPYSFAPTSPYTAEERRRLCLGRVEAEYIRFCATYAFPLRHQLPTSVGTEPAQLLLDPSSPHPVVYLQLFPDFPPAMWLPIRGTAEAVRRVLSEFAQQAAVHRDRHHSSFAQRFEEARRTMRAQRLPCEEDGDVLRFLAYDARNAQYAAAPIREFPNEQVFFLGEYHDPETELMERFDLCPFLFAVPHMRTFVDPHAEHATPTVDGPGVAPSLYRCIFSKALLMVYVQLSAEVKLPPQDPAAFQLLWRDAQAVPKTRIPVFARVIWPDSTRMGAEGLLARRFNALFGTEFAWDVPPDAIMTLLYTARWAGRLPDLLGVRGLRQRVAELEMAVLRQPPPEQLYPGTREVPNPEYTLAERLGMHVQYLSMVGDPRVGHTLKALLQQAGLPAAARMGCAKAALIAGDRQLFRGIVSQEPPGRMQHYMTRLARKRKTRDLVDPEPRFLDGQFEFAAPLWTKRGTRVDRNTLEGALDAVTARLAR